MQLEIIAIAVSVLGTAAATVCSAVALRRARDRETAKNGSSSGAILVELGYIKSGIEDIKSKQLAADERYIKLAERMAKVESSAAQAHKRIDERFGSVRAQNT